MEPFYSVQKREAAQDAEINRILAVMAQKERGCIQQKMDLEMEVKRAEAAEAVMKKYTEKYPEIWKESETGKALRKFTKSLSRSISGI